MWEHEAEAGEERPGTSHGSPAASREAFKAQRRVRFNRHQRQQSIWCCALCWRWSVQCLHGWRLLNYVMMNKNPNNQLLNILLKSKSCWVCHCMALCEGKTVVLQRKCFIACPFPLAHSPWHTDTYGETKQKKGKPSSFIKCCLEQHNLGESCTCSPFSSVTILIQLAFSEVKTRQDPGYEDDYGLRGFNPHRVSPERVCHPLMAVQTQRWFLKQEGCRTASLFKSVSQFRQGSVLMLVKTCV